VKEVAQSAYLARFDSFEVNLRSGELSNNGKRIRLQEQSFQVLAMLLERPGEVVTRQEIQQRLWPNDTVVEFENSISAAIRRLRVALGDSAERPRYVETLARRGYRWKASVVWTEPLPTESQAPVPPPVSPPIDSPASHLIGKKVSHYRVLEILGGGGMGVVYMAEDLMLGRRVAMKFLPEELGGDAKARERFEREARAVSSLSHPNVCPIYEFDEYEGQPFIVMELLKGKTLREHLADGAFRLTDPQGLDIAVQVASGLEAAHEKGIIHRDIKPANIFVTEKKVAKILDFGVAKVLEAGKTQEPAATAGPEGIGSNPVLTRSGWKPGTAGYMSPEQICGEPLDVRTDIFSFGVVLYEMATGDRAFTNETERIQQEAVLTDDPRPVREFTPAISPKLDVVITKCLEKARDQRYRNGSELHQALVEVQHSESSPRHEKLKSEATRRWVFSSLIMIATAVGITAGVKYWRSHRTIKLTDKDQIVLSDFSNTTGNPVFDDTLKQGLAVQLEQSPFLKLLSESKVNGTLKLMGRQAGESVTPEVAREICQRTGSKATLTGSIVALGSQYVIGLKAVNCQTGDTLAEAQQQAPSKEVVLKAVDAAAATMRGRLGESLSSVQRYGTPLEEATTPSLEALKAYSLGHKTHIAMGSSAAALPFFKRAVELDPNFALSYEALSVMYRNLNEVGRGAENARKAFELREKVSERERFQIESTYYFLTTGELEKAAQVYELWRQTYPRDSTPLINLGVVFTYLGNYEKAMGEDKEAMRLDPDSATTYVDLAIANVNLNRLEEAEKADKRAEERKLENETLSAVLYVLAFLKGDTAQMEKLAASAIGRPGTEDLLLAMQADTEAWYGKLGRARELTRRAMDSAQYNDAKESAAGYEALAGLREVESANRAQARANVGAAQNLSANRDVRAIAALVLARAGDTAAAEKLASELDKAFPLDTLVQRYWLPTIRAGVALERKDPRRAIELLQASSTMELGSPTGLSVSLCPVYLRGEAYLMLQDGNAAAAEFQKFIDHRGVVTNFPWGALARLGLARAYAIQGETTKARSAYQDFLTLWKDADPDVPILKQAKTEYAKLQN